MPTPVTSALLGLSQGIMQGNKQAIEQYSAELKRGAQAEQEELLRLQQEQLRLTIDSKKREMTREDALEYDRLMADQSALEERTLKNRLTSETIRFIDFLPPDERLKVMRGLADKMSGASETAQREAQSVYYRAQASEATARAGLYGSQSQWYSERAITESMQRDENLALLRGRVRELAGDARAQELENTFTESTLHARVLYQRELLESQTSELQGKALMARFTTGLVNKWLEDVGQSDEPWAAAFREALVEKEVGAYGIAREMTGDALNIAKLGGLTDALRRTGAAQTRRANAARGAAKVSDWWDDPYERQLGPPGLSYKTYPISQAPSDIMERVRGSLMLMRDNPELAGTGISALEAGMEMYLGRMSLPLSGGRMFGANDGLNSVIITKAWADSVGLHGRPLNQLPDPETGRPYVLATQEQGTYVSVPKRHLKDAMIQAAGIELDTELALQDPAYAAQPQTMNRAFAYFFNSYVQNAGELMPPFYRAMMEHTANALTAGVQQAARQEAAAQPPVKARVPVGPPGAGGYVETEPAAAAPLREDVASILDIIAVPYSIGAEMGEPGQQALVDFMTAALSAHESAQSSEYAMHAMGRLGDDFGEVLTDSAGNRLFLHDRLPDGTRVYRDAAGHEKRWTPDALAADVNSRRITVKKPKPLSATRAPARPITPGAGYPLLPGDRPPIPVVDHQRAKGLSERDLALVNARHDRDLSYAAFALRGNILDAIGERVPGESIDALRRRIVSYYMAPDVTPRDRVYAAAAANKNRSAELRRAIARGLPWPKWTNSLRQGASYEEAAGALGIDNMLKQIQPAVDAIYRAEQEGAVGEPVSILDLVPEPLDLPEQLLPVPRSTISRNLSEAVASADPPRIRGVLAAKELLENALFESVSEKEGGLSVEIPDTAAFGAHELNNPGLLGYSDMLRAREGATRSEDGLAKFATPEKGYAGLFDVVLTNSLRVGQSLGTFLANYGASLDRTTGVPGETFASDALSALQREQPAYQETTPLIEVDSQSLARVLARLISGTEVYYA